MKRIVGYLKIAMLGIAVISAAPRAHAAPQKAPHAVTPQDVVREYASMVYVVYWDSARAAQRLQEAVDALLAEPSAPALEAARAAWIAARDVYGLSEAFRFYEGPIDFADAQGREGPEARLNAWPLNEAYIDYVVGNPQAGIVQEVATPITRALLVEKNQATDEADVATGYHAIEFLLWGQDMNLDGPGSRPHTEFLPTDAVHERRRVYLREVTALLVEDLAFLVKSWEPKAENYAAAFVKDERALAHMLTGLATLSGFELASERMATALDSGDQEDEHSCFSDTTHRDFIANVRGISHVYFNRYRPEEGGQSDASLHALLAAQDPALAEKLAAQVKRSVALVEALPHPVDREILATPEGSPARAKMEEAIAALQQQADLLKRAGAVLGVSVEIVSE